jgi:hypothetical protein
LTISRFGLAGSSFPESYLLFTKGNFLPQHQVFEVNRLIGQQAF